MVSAWKFLQNIKRLYGRDDNMRGPRAHSRCGKPRSRAGVELTGVFQSAVPVFGVIDRFIHVTTKDAEGRSIVRVPVAVVQLYPRASRVVATDGSVSPHHHVSTQLDRASVYYFRASQLGRVVAFSPSARLPGTFAVLYCHSLPGRAFKFTF